jgi:hypothetical protein
LVFLALLVACSFDSQTDSVGGASLGEGEDSTSGVSGSPSTGSASASATSTPSTTMPGTSDASAMSGASETDPVAETGEPTTSPTTTLPDTTTSASDSRTSSDSMTTDGTMMPTTEMPTTEMPEELYPPCFDGDCPPDHQCRHYSTDVDPLAFSICTPLDCGNDDDCPDPSTGMADTVCVGSMPTFCQLDCAMAMDDCPTGMECVWVTDIDVYRCLWPD